MTPEIRKIVQHAEEVHIEGGRIGERPVTAVAMAAVLTNPWRGKGFVEDLRPVILAVAPVLGEALVSRLVSFMPAARIEAYGKAALVGVNGEVEHGSALIHTLRFGNLFRDAVGGTSYLEFTNSRGSAGANLAIPMTHKSESGKRSHFITLDLVIGDAPGPDEIVIAIAAADGGRLHPRIGDRFQDMKEMGLSA